MKATTLARVENRLRPFLIRLPPKFVISEYSKGRLDFLMKLKEESSCEHYINPNLSRELWGIKFKSPIMNAAGMFKNGECYEMVAKQCAGAYLGGTGTWNPRNGNERLDISLPFVPYPRSHAASNWLGLPNEGDVINAERASKLERIADCPVGWSVMGSPDFQGEEKLINLVKGMWLYKEAGVDFIEINESCPNTENRFLQDSGLAERLKYIKEKFLDKRDRRIPVIVKFSNDTVLKQVPRLLDLLFQYDYDGVNFGNTSVDYERRRWMIDLKERRLYDFFVKTFGGGISGKPLKKDSLHLASFAVDYANVKKPSQEFHVIRTGGIETIEDIKESERAGISLNQWYTWYIENFAKYGHNVYSRLFIEFERLL